MTTARFVFVSIDIQHERPQRKLKATKCCLLNFTVTLFLPSLSSLHHCFVKASFLTLDSGKLFVCPIITLTSLRLSDWSGVWRFALLKSLFMSTTEPKPWMSSICLNWSWIDLERLIFKTQFKCENDLRPHMVFLVALVSVHTDWVGLYHRLQNLCFPL